MRTIHFVLGTAATLLAFAGCSKGEEGKAPPPTVTATPTAAATPLTPVSPPSTAPSAAPPAPKIEIAIASVANTMMFDKTKLTVPAGAEVHLTFKNNATQDVLPHNWVLVKPKTEAAVAAEGLANAVDAGYVVPGPNVLAYTPLAPPGKTTEVTFTAPEAGTYPFICTFPGHYIMMKGVLTVTP
jgi:azurin